MLCDNIVAHYALKICCIVYTALHTILKNVVGSMHCVLGSKQ